jgi:hypothetical protein
LVGPAGDHSCEPCTARRRRAATSSPAPPISSATPATIQPGPIEAPVLARLPEEVEPVAVGPLVAVDVWLGDELELLGDGEVGGSASTTTPVFSP